MDCRFFLVLALQLQEVKAFSSVPLMRNVAECIGLVLTSVFEVHFKGQPSQYHLPASSCLYRRRLNAHGLPLRIKANSATLLD